MKKFYLILLYFIFVYSFTNAQQPPIQLQWLNTAQEYYNGGDFIANDAVSLSDGSTVVAGYFGGVTHYALARYNNESKKQIIINKIKHYISTHNNATAETLHKKITLYPNPVNNILTIKGLDTKINYELLMMNDRGSVVATKQLSNVASYQFNVQNLSSGVYYLNVVASNKVVSTLKFVKQ